MRASPTAVPSSTHWPRACSNGCGPRRRRARAWARACCHRAGPASRGAGPTLALVPLWLAVVVGAALVLGALMWMSTRLSRQAAAGAAAAARHAPCTGRRAARRAGGQGARWRRCWPMTSTPARIDVAEDAQRSVITLGADTLFVRRHRAAAGRRTQAPGGASPRRSPACPGASRCSATPTTSRWSRCASRRTGTCRASARRRWPPRWSRPACRRHALRAEGRAETEPRVPNDSPSARARNRRIEVLLLLPRPEI